MVEFDGMRCDESSTSTCSSVAMNENELSEHLLRNQEINVINNRNNNSRMMSENVINDTIVKQAQFQPHSVKNNGAKDVISSNFATNALSAAGAAFLSAVIVNPLDVAKTRLQAQAAGAQYAHPLSNAMSRMAFFGPTMMFADLRCSPTCARAGIQGTVSFCPPDCFQYKGMLDVLYKIVRQEGVTRLWRGTNAGLALAVPMSYGAISC